MSRNNYQITMFEKILVGSIISFFFIFKTYSIIHTQILEKKSEKIISQIDSYVENNGCLPKSLLDINANHGYINSIFTYTIVNDTTYILSYDLSAEEINCYYSDLKEWKIN